ncbi:MAG TPA: LytR C-terminal domain-containing protein [Actinocrinis sp.]|nr:LytR C-terminal domain-containing protein [Actinocrinis sp.]
MDLTPSQASSSEEEPAGAPQHQEPGVTPGPNAVTAASATPAAAATPGATGAVTLGRSTAKRTGPEIGGKKFRVGTGDEYVPFRSRTKRRRRLIVTVAVAAVLLAAGGFGIVSLFSSPAQAPAASACTSKANAAAAAARKVDPRLPATAQIKVNVYNSTDRHGLAATTAAQLKQRGFTVLKVTNDPLKANLTVPAQIRGATGDTAAMHVVAAEVAGSQLKPDARTDGTVDLVLGTGFTALASPDQVSAALKAVTAAPAKASSACAS